MKAYFIIFLIAVHMATATLTIDKITEKVQAGLKILKDKAVNKLHKLKHEIDLKKLHQFDVAHFLPYGHKHYIHEHYSKKTPFVIDHHQIQRLKHYFEPHHKPHVHLEPIHKPHIHLEPIHKPHIHLEPIHKPHIHLEPLHKHIHVEPLHKPLHYHHFEHIERHI